MGIYIMIKKIVMLSMLLFVAADMAAHPYTDRVLIEIEATQDKAKKAYEAFIDAKKKILQENSDYSAARKQWFECDTLHGNQSQACRSITQNLEKALDVLGKTDSFNKEYLPALEDKNYQMARLQALGLMIDFISKESDESSSQQALFDAINALPQSERDVSLLWIELADNPAKSEEKVKNDLRDFVQEVAKS